jgi:hypothetical protein
MWIYKRNDLRQALLDALRRGHVDFVELLIEYGASLEKLTIADIEQLYEIVDVCIDVFGIKFKQTKVFRLIMDYQWKRIPNQLEMIIIQFISINYLMYIRMNNKDMN